MKKLLCIFALSFLPACVGMPTADTFNQKLAIAISTVTAVRSTATTLLQAKKISVEDAQNVQAGADNARQGVEIARTISKVDVSAADQRLTAVTTVLSALQTYLASKEK